MNVDMDTVGWVINSENREKVVRRLDDAGRATPNGLKRESESMPSISRALGQLRDEGVVELLTEENRQDGRIYALTDTGKEVAEEMETVQR